MSTPDPSAPATPGDAPSIGEILPCTILLAEGGEVEDSAARLLPADTQLALLFREERAFLYPVLILPGGRDLQLLPWPAETPAGAAGADLRLPPEGWLRLPQAGAVRLIGAPAALTPAALRAIARVREPDTTKNDDRKR